MATIKLVIRKDKANAQGECLVYLLYTHQAVSVKLSTNVKINPQYWDEDGQKVRRSLRGFTVINDLLSEKKAQLEKFVRELLIQGIEPNVNFVKENFLKQFAPVQIAEPVISEVDKKLTKPFLDVYQVYLADQTLYTVGTIKRFKTVHTHITHFLGSDVNVPSNAFDRERCNHFLKFLHSLGLQNNTIGNIIKTFKTVMHWALENGYLTDPAFKKLVRPSAPTDIIYLNSKELEILMQLDLNSKPSLDRVRDLFIFECCTGLRYSDLQNLKSEDIKENHIEITAIKTMDKLRIPLNPIAISVLKKYGGGLPRVVANQKMNEMLKEIGKLAELTEPVKIVRFYGSKRMEEVLEKYQLISSHTARRTFVTQSLERGMRPEVIMKLTGHSDIKTMMKYVKITEKKVEEEFLNAWNTI
jgi:site-specific recombinase XerD